MLIHSIAHVKVYGSFGGGTVSDLGRDVTHLRLAAKCKLNTLGHH